MAKYEENIKLTAEADFSGLQKQLDEINKKAAANRPPQPAAAPGTTTPGAKPAAPPVRTPSERPIGKGDDTASWKGVGQGIVGIFQGRDPGISNRLGDVIGRGLGKAFGARASEPVLPAMGKAASKMAESAAETSAALRVGTGGAGAAGAGGLGALGAAAGVVAVLAAVGYGIKKLADTMNAQIAEDKKYNAAVAASAARFEGGQVAYDIRTAQRNEKGDLAWLETKAAWRDLGEIADKSWLGEAWRDTKEWGAHQLTDIAKLFGANPDKQAVMNDPAAGTLSGGGGVYGAAGGGGRVAGVTAPQYMPGPIVPMLPEVRQFDQKMAFNATFTVSDRAEVNERINDVRNWLEHGLACARDETRLAVSLLDGRGLEAFL